MSDEINEENKFPIAKSVRITKDMLNEMKLIVTYEHTSGVSSLLRDWITDKIRQYQRNPQYLRFKKQLEEKKLE
jgi:hypothetical protein